MSRVEIYTTRYCPYCHRRQRAADPQGGAFTEIDVSGDPEDAPR